MLIAKTVYIKLCGNVGAL